MPADAPLSELPIIAALQDDDSMLTRRFGKEVVNYYAGGRINRYSFLRADAAFLRRASVSPTARYLALNDLNPLVVDKKKLAYLTFDDVQSLVGPDPFGLTEDEAIQAFDSAQTKPLIVFLGMLEGDNETDHIASGDHGNIKGHPYFAVDITPKGTHAEKATSFLADKEGKGLSLDKNPRAMSHNPDAGKPNPISLSVTQLLTFLQPPCTPRQGLLSTGTPGTHSALAVDSQTFLFMLVTSESAPQRTARAVTAASLELTVPHATASPTFASLERIPP